MEKKPVRWMLLLFSSSAAGSSETCLASWLVSGCAVRFAPVDRLELVLVWEQLPSGLNTDPPICCLCVGPKGPSHSFLEVSRNQETAVVASRTFQLKGHIALVLLLDFQAGLPLYQWLEGPSSSGSSGLPGLPFPLAHPGRVWVGVLLKQCSNWSWLEMRKNEIIKAIRLTTGGLHEGCRVQLRGWRWPLTRRTAPDSLNACTPVTPTEQVGELGPQTGNIAHPGLRALDPRPGILLA